MSFNSMMTDVSRVVTTFWLRASKELTDTRAKIQANNYTANDLANSLAKTWSNAIDVWMAFAPFPSPTIPTVCFSDAAANYVGQQPTLHASLSFSLPSNPQLHSTDLVQISGTKTIPAAQVTATGADTEIDVTLKLTSAPAVGIYAGFVHYGAPPQVIAQVIVAAG